MDKRLKTQCKEDDVSRRLRAIPGVGPAIATAMPAFSTAVGSVASGSAVAAWLGIAARHRSSGGRDRTFGIATRGNACLRRQSITGARAVLRRARGRRGGVWEIDKMLDRRHSNIVTVAVADTMARILWARIAKGPEHRPA